MDKYSFLGVLLLLFVSCHQKDTELTAQDIVDKSIALSGGRLYKTSQIDFDFRDAHYRLKIDNKQRILERITKNDSLTIRDIKEPKDFNRYINDSLVTLVDSVANSYANAVNSVHYFAYLPYGLNDPAVHKDLVGMSEINGESYYKVKVTFDKVGGGDDFDDTYVYWFNSKTFKPDYLAYEFHVNGGGQRFRKAYNERVVGGIRFVDYMNYKPKVLNTSIMAIDSLYNNGRLELLSKISLENVTVNQGSYN